MAPNMVMVNTTDLCNRSAMIEVRQIRPDEWPLLKRVRLAALADSPRAFSETLEEVKLHTDAVWRERAGGTFSFCAIAVDEAEPVGMAVGLPDPQDSDLSYLVAMWVAPSRRSSATARALVECVESWAFESGRRILFVGVTAHNDRAVAFYRKCGFAIYTDKPPLHPAIQGCETVLSKKSAK